MTILFDARRTVKPTRRFGAGLLASAPTYRDEVSLADRQWWAEECARMEDAWIDELADERAAEDALTRGLIPADPEPCEVRGCWGGHPAFEDF